MARPATVTPDAIRATVLAMLAEAGETAPASDARFRKIVSVRKLRARLGAGGPATLSRHLNAIEAEVVQAGLTGFAVPDVPAEIAAQMRALWEAAVATQLDGIVRLRRETEATVEASTEAQRNAGLKVELLRVELADVRAQLSARDAEVAVARAGSRRPGNAAPPLKTRQPRCTPGSRRWKPRRLRPGGTTPTAWPPNAYAMTACPGSCCGKPPTSARRFTLNGSAWRARSPGRPSG